MRIRGEAFWRWADPKLHSRSHEERLDDGTLIDIQVRLSRVGTTQLFLGIYDADGSMIHEEGYDSRPGESMTKAMAWGVQRARHLATEGKEDSSRTRRSQP